MKKILVILCIVIIAILIIPSEDSEFRIRVIANSDSVEDQALKMKVVNGILSEIKEYDEENIENEVKDNIDEINKIIKKIVKDEEYSLRVKKVRFPPKELDGEIIRGGKYKALVVVIGEGKGKNWWSILNPDFHKGFEDVEGGDVEFKFYIFEEIKKGLSDNK